MRGANESLNLETINVARKYLGKGVVALDLAGAEALFPNELYKLGYKDIKNLDQEQWEYNKQIRLKDRYLKVRVRYSGKDLAIVQSVITLFRISYA